LAENTEVVGLSDGTGDVIATAVFIFRDSQAGTGKVRIDFLLKAIEQTHGAVETVGDPRYFPIAWIPKTARTLHYGLDL